MHSTTISHRPRVNRNVPSADGVLRDVIRPALVPARNTNTGAQKCVIQRVKKSAAPMAGLAIGSCLAAEVEEVPHVIDGHDDDHETAQHVDARNSVGAPLGTLGRHGEDDGLADCNHGGASIAAPSRTVSGTETAGSRMLGFTLPNDGDDDEDRQDEDNENEEDANRAPAGSRNHCGGDRANFRDGPGAGED